VKKKRRASFKKKVHPKPHKETSGRKVSGGGIRHTNVFRNACRDEMEGRRKSTNFTAVHAEKVVEAWSGLKEKRRPHTQNKGGTNKKHNSTNQEVKEKDVKNRMGANVERGWGLKKKKRSEKGATTGGGDIFWPNKPATKWEREEECQRTSISPDTNHAGTEVNKKNKWKLSRSLATGGV